jgi:glucan phosphorylase
VQGLVAKPMRRVTAASSVKNEIVKKVEYVAGADPSHLTAKDVYQGAAHTVRELLFDRFNRTNKYMRYDCSHIL